MSIFILILVTILSNGLCQNEPDINTYRNFSRLLDLQSVCDNMPHNVSDDCREQFTEICKNKTLLFTMYDANSKFPYTGLETVSRTDLGNYDECIAIDHKYDKGRILGKYCNNGLIIYDPQNIWNFLNYFKLSVCKPDKCTANDFSTMFNFAGYSDSMCQTKEDIPGITTYDIVAICLIGAIISLMVLSTVYDVILRKFDQKTVHPLLLAFSVQSNWQKLTKTIDQDNREQVLVINGIKVFSMMWVLYGHISALWLMVGLFVNESDKVKFTNSLNSFYITCGPYAVDSFFYIAGFLTAWSYLKIKSLPLKTQIFSIPMGYLHRYIRLTPSLAVLLMVNMSIYRHMGSGPMWDSKPEENCKDYWWSFLLYIQNYYNYRNLCMGHTWYLSADMQMFVLAPLVLIPLAFALRNPNWLIHCMIALFVLNFIVTGVPIWMLLENRENINNFATHYRLVDYCIGIMVASFMRETKNQPFFGKKLSEKMKWYLNLVIWCVILVVLGVLLVETRQIEMDNVYDTYWTFEMLKRVVWSVIISWIIYSSYHGYGGVISYLLSTPLMQIGGKLSYSFYIIHWHAITYTMATVRTMYYFSQYSLFLSFGSHFVVITLLSIVWTLAFESPFINIDNYLLRRATAKKE